MYLRRDSSGRVLSPGPGSRPSPAPEEWRHFISLSITPTLAILLCTPEVLNFDIDIVKNISYSETAPNYLLVERAYQRFQTLKND